MKVFDGNWQAFLARTVVFGIVVFGAVRLAVADPGGPASPDTMTYSGVLRTATGAPFVGTTTLTFIFHKGGSSASACSPDPSVVVTIPTSANGAFSALVPMDPMRCPRSIFDGTAVTYDVLQMGETTPIATNVPITPVPYARFADQAGVALELAQRDGWQRVGADHWQYNIYLRGAEVPTCTANFMTYNVGFPQALGSTRDTLMNGTISVMTRPDVSMPWNETTVWLGVLSGYTHSGYNPTICSSPRLGIPATCWDSQMPPPREFISLRRPDGDSSRLNVIAPCGRTMNRLAIHIDAWLRHPD